jgi:hypothetical protein
MTPKKKVGLQFYVCSPKINYKKAKSHLLLLFRSLWTNIITQSSVVRVVVFTSLQEMQSNPLHAPPSSCHHRVLPNELAHLRQHATPLMVTPILALFFP